MAAPPPPPPPVLPDDVVEEILLRIPPEDPGLLLRATFVCKGWSRVASQPHFRGRFLERHLHRAPPVLGFFHDWGDERIPDFVPTASSPFSLAAPDRRFWRALDCRHGRALFLSRSQDPEELLVWEPITGAHQRIPLPAAFRSVWPAAAVFCTADGCDHRECLGGPFRVVFVFSVDDDADDVTSACVYSSETATWGELTSTHHEVTMDFRYHSSVLVGESLLYFLSDGGTILEYNLGSHAMALLETPPDRYRTGNERFNIMLANGGGLGVVEAMDPELVVWSRNNDEWVSSQFIHLDILLPTSVGPEHYVLVLGFAEGANAIFVRTFDSLYMIELQSQKVKRVFADPDCCKLIPLVSFYTPQSRPQVPGGEHHDPALRLRRGGQQGEWEEKSLKWAQDLFNKGCKAMNEKDFNNAVDCFRYALKNRVQHYGGLALECASTFSRYGCALLCRTREATNPPGNVSKCAPNEESIKITPTTSTSKDDAGSSEASSSSGEHVQRSSKGDYEEGVNLIGKDREDGNTTGDGDDSDLDLAWKMLNTARAIVAKSPEHTGEKFNIFYALAEVSMRREDRDNSTSYYIKALAILEHLVRPDHIRIANLNFRICLALELASEVGDAIPYCAKAISVCKSCMQNLENAKEALLADKNVSTSAAKECSENFTIENEISSIATILARSQKKLGELEQAMSTPSSCIDKSTKNVVSVTCHEQNVRNTIAGSNNSLRSPTMSTAAATGTAGSSVTDLVIVGRDMKRGNDKPILDEPSPKRLAADDSPSVNEM